MSGKTVLLLGNYRPALSIARELASLGYDVIVSSGGGEGCCEYSRSVCGKWEHPAVETDEEGFLEALLDFLGGSPDRKLVFPITESYVHCLAKNAHRLPADVTVVSPEPATVLRCSDKLAMLDLATDVDVPVLPFAVAEQGSDFEKLAGHVGFPMVARPLPPRIRFGHQKAIFIEGPGDYQRFLGEWIRPQEKILLQRRAFGSRHNVYFVAYHGQVVRSLETKILRTDHREGTGLAVDGITCPPTKALSVDCARLVAALEYTGVGLAQFQLDPATGERCFLEINPRIAGSQDIAEQTGLQSAGLAIELAIGSPVDTVQPVAINRPGLRYCWTYGDLRGLRSSLANGEIGLAGALAWMVQLIWSAVRADYHMTWRILDPLPTVMLFVRQLLPAGKGTHRIPITSRKTHELPNA